MIKLTRILSISVRRIMLAIALITVITPAGPSLSDGSKPYGKGLLWQLTSPGDQSSYIFGFSWWLHPDLAEPSSRLLEVFHRSERLVIQVPLSDEDIKEFGEMQRVGNGPTLALLLKKDLYRRAKAALDRYWASNLILGQLNPWGLVVILQVTPDHWVRSNRGELPVGARLFNRAERRGLPIVTLQSLEDQASYLADISSEELEPVILEVLERNYWIEEYDQFLQKLYREERTADLYDIFTTAEPDFKPTVFGQLNREDIRQTIRRIWPGLLESLKQDFTFVAVEFQLLPGEDGILSRLAKEGYKIRRVQ